MALTEYQLGAIDERDRIVTIVRKVMRTSGHKGALDCLCCDVARDFIDEITMSPVPYSTASRETGVQDERAIALAAAKEIEQSHSGAEQITAMLIVLAITVDAGT